MHLLASLTGKVDSRDICVAPACHCAVVPVAAGPFVQASAVKGPAIYQAYSGDLVDEP